MPDAMIEKMRLKAVAAMKNAYCPYSHFAVGCSILADDGNIYVGCNVENSVFLATHAEVSAISAMICAGAKRVKKILIIADCDRIIVPCGGCRQHLREFSSEEVPVYMFNNLGKSDLMTIGELLVKSFGPEYLEGCEHVNA